ncbi:response regulator transcription factor [Sphingomonas ginsenosidivorax]|uniref:Response regulator transcription factor n=1 Tax=Sphingomonas ginsenosidivorax TaxID=862135 RepID=A0A5C6U9V1_9SPHN|nr:response regulator [Sphingomonas ginsenosidivorax]TXC69652.1 response regulator transcription factor [Sphingomonas ginsenosidivorax]
MATRNIYIVDDDQSVRAGLQSLLATQPSLMVFTYRSGEDFVAQIADLEPGCLLLDYNMPGMDGLDVLEAIADVRDRFGTIILTGQGAISVAVRAWKLGALDFLEKPCDPALLLQAVESAFTIVEQDQQKASVAERAKKSVDSLTQREQDVLLGLIEGRANKLIAYDLAISPRTVEIHRAKLMAKLGVRSLSEALRIAFAAGLIPIR